jgi:hypothetical protein
VTREEAEARCASLNAELAEGDARHWLVREASEGGYEVVRVNLPGLSGTRGPLKESTEARPRPEADDPRPSNVQQIPPYGAI